MKSSQTWRGSIELQSVKVLNITKIMKFISSEFLQPVFIIQLSFLSDSSLIFDMFSVLLNPRICT